MRIGFDVSQTAEDMAGCGFFSKQIISHLLELDSENNYLLYPVFYGYRHPDFKQAYFSEQPNVTGLFRDLSWKKVNQMWNDAKDMNVLLEQPDIVHSNNFSMPKGISAKKVMTIYDMGYLDCPEYTTEENRLVCLNGAFEASLYADHIVTISNFSKESFLKYFPYYPEERVSVVYLGNRPTLRPINDQEVIDKVRSKFDLGESFWLGVGTIEPRKNYRLLLEAYARLVENQTDSKPLYIAGGKGWMESSIQDKIKELGIDKRVKFLGYVSDEELSVLYTKCYAFIYPSFYEGFGLPILEAMSCGAPVITSNVSSIPEVIGDAGVTIDPREATSLAQAMQILNDDSGFRNELIAKSKRQAEKFSWNRAAQQMLDIYEKELTSKSWH